MKKAKKLISYFYIIIALFIISILVFVYKYNFDFFTKAAENTFGCNINLLNKKDSDMGDCFYTFGGRPLSDDVARLANDLSSNARILCEPKEGEKDYEYFLLTNRYSVKKENQHCMDSAIVNLFPSNSQISLVQIASSTNSYDAFQCVGFVQTVISGIYGRPLNYGGDARDFIYNVPTGYRFMNKNQNSSKIQSGDIALWDDGVNGHIAIVLQRADESENSYRFRVAEANWHHPGYINNNRWESSDFPAFKGWLRKI